MQKDIWLSHFKNKPFVLSLTLILAITAIAIPILFALHQSREQGLSVAKDRAIFYATDVLSRSDKTADQVAAGIAKLMEAKLEDPCSAKALMIMRQIDLSSSYIQSIGHVSENRLVCSSLAIDESMELGPPDFVTSKGTIIRANVKLSFAPSESFVVLERDGYAAIIHKDLPVDTTTSEPDVSLAIVSRDVKKILSERGFIAPEWIQKNEDKSQIVFVDGNYVVALVRSTRYLTTAVAAVPLSFVNQQTNSVAMLLIPVGFFLGLILTVAIFFLTRFQLSMPAAIKTALKRKEFILRYQPIINLRTGKCVGAEALIRWRRSMGETINPDVFIPIAEKAGLIHRITERVMELVAEDIGDLFSRYPEFHIAINLSSMDMQTHHTVTLLHQLIEKTGAGPNNFIVEATEHGIMHEENAHKIIQDIHDCGINIAIDDFGTGYSSLAYLQRFTLDLLKIDKSFVDTIGTEALTGQVIRHIIDLAKALKLKLVAEGVETQQQADYLREQGVDYAQGWLFGKPVAIGFIFLQLANENKKEDDI